MIVYNLSNPTGASIESRVTSPLGLLFSVGNSGSGIVIAAGMGLGILVISKLSADPSRYVPIIAWVAAISLPVEILVSSGISGNNYAHYAQAWLPSLAILSAFAIQFIFQRIYLKSISSDNRFTQPFVIVGFATIVIVSIPMLGVINDIYKTTRNPGPQSKIVQYVSAHTERDDQLLVWGAGTDINLMSERESPTRFTYQYPLFAPGYSTRAMYAEFTSGVMNARPKMIIDASSATFDRVPPLLQSSYIDEICSKDCTFQSTEQFSLFLQFVKQEYKQVETIGSSSAKRVIYLLSE